MLKPVLRYLPLVALVLVLPELAQASGGISEFSSPLEKVVQTVTGPAGRWVSIVAMVFEIEELMQLGDKNLIPVLLHLFHRIETALAGQPALLILDEAWVMAGSAKGQMRQWFEANNPFDRAKEGKLVQVSIKGLPLPVSQDSWRVEWTETVRGHTGAVLVDPQTFEATLTVQLQPPATDAQVMQNPGGIAITGLSFSRVLSGGSDK